ncbi:hypothetical protein CHARACLAT_020912 [Characodon lateralis]|uniref:Uncharacterized protein n=1 Tax=Characodon lateralis TaxID=208331 RepID=A0ABU7EER5_9TELE|nr:hypothetical protein [Characodon lateralis]
MVTGKSSRTANELDPRAECERAVSPVAVQPRASSQQSLVLYSALKSGFIQPFESCAARKRFESPRA